MLKTKRLILRPILAKDKQAIFNYRSDAATNKYQGWIPKTLEEVEQFITKSTQEFNQTGTWFQLVIILQESQEIIGDLGIHFIDERQCELGCTLSKSQQGKGFATEALAAVINHLFTVLNKHRIKTSIDPNNLDSIRLVERLGFRKEAHFKESLWMNGKWVDDIIYAILEKEWKL